MNAVAEKTVTVQSRAIEKLKRDLGDVIQGALDNPKTVDVMCNPDGKIWQECVGEKMRCIGSISEGRADSIIKTVAAFHGKEIKKATPLLEATLPTHNGARFTAQLSPAVERSTFNIRAKASQVFPLSSYVEKGIMTVEQRGVLQQAVKEHRNILVVGSTGTGKTTLVNAIIDEMVKQEPSERIVIIEDTGEIQCRAENSVQYHATLGVDMTQLIRTTLRMRPDRILVGEVRGAEALDLLDAWNTGHEGGIATLHANDALSGLTRLKSLVSRNPFAPKDIEPLIGEAVHCVVHIVRSAGGRKVAEIIAVNGYSNGHYQIQTIG